MSQMMWLIDWPEHFATWHNIGSPGRIPTHWYAEEHINQHEHPEGRIWVPHTHAEDGSVEVNDGNAQVPKSD